METRQSGKVLRVRETKWGGEGGMKRHISAFVCNNGWVTFDDPANGGELSPLSVHYVKKDTKKESSQIQGKDSLGKEGRGQAEAHLSPCLQE